MAEVVVAPSGPEALDVGLMIDEHGDRFVVLTFREGEGDPVLVTFTVPLFERYAAHLARAADFARDERNWQAP